MSRNPVDIEEAQKKEDAIVSARRVESRHTKSEANYEYHQPTQRRLKSRHIAWIGLGGGIGVGLFVGSGAALAKSGPAGTLLAYIITGSIVFCMIQSLAEMATLFPTAGSTPHFVKRFLDPSVGFAVGWNYWYLSATSVASELSASALLIRFWSDINPAVWITILFIPMIVINLCMVQAYGEAEVIMSSIKVITFCGLIILGLVIDLGGAPNHVRTGFYYWQNPGAFASLDGIPGSWGHFLAFFSTFVASAFSYGGTESVIFAAGEASAPSKQIPKAAKLVVFRLLFFYICGALLVGMLCAPPYYLELELTESVPYTEPKLLGGSSNVSASPFVIAIQNAGINALPSIFTAAVLTSAWSAGNTYLYIGSRILVSLSLDHTAPQIFTRVSKRGVPYYAVLFTAILGLLAYLSAGSGGASQAFEWLLALNGLTYVLLWGAYTLTFIRFRAALKAQDIPVSSLTWHGYFQPYAAWYAHILCWLIALLSGFSVFVKGHWDTSTFISNYISVPVFFVPMIFWKLVKNQPVRDTQGRADQQRIRAEDADLWTGRLDPSEEVMEPPPKTWYGKIGTWIIGG